MNNFSKPLLTIDDERLVSMVLDKDWSVSTELYDKYGLTIGELASLYDMNYSNTRAKLLSNGVNTNNHSGRRNASYGATFSDERRRKISLSHAGKLPAAATYVRTDEIKAKISKTLRDKYASGELTVNKDGISKAWLDGKFDNSPMGRGIQGYFHSNKTTRPNGMIYFRSLLELSYLIKAENSNEVTSIINEAVHIKLPSGGIYIPDFLINGHILTELKPRNHLLWTKDKYGRFDEEVTSANEYCNQRGWTYRIIYDDELDFDSSKFKRAIINDSLIEKYGIKFNDISRIIGH